MERKLRLLPAAFALMLISSAVLFPVAAQASGGGSATSGISQSVSPKSMSLNVRDADVRDVLSAVAMNMGYSVVYKGEAGNITVKLENVTPAAALDYILKIIGMTYVQEGSTIIVSTRETLLEDFARSLTLTRFDLKYITPDVLTSKIVQLNLPVTVLTLDANETALWIQGFPLDIAKVRDLITVLDIEENFDVGGVDQSDQEVKTLSYIHLNYLSAYEFNRFLKTLGVENGLAISDDADYLWIYATPAERKTILDIRSKVDRSSIDVDINQADAFKTLRVTNISKATAINAISAVCPGLTVISVDNAAKAFFVSGESYDIERASELIDELDRINDNAISTTFFNYKLTHITAAEAARRLAGVTFGDSVRWYVSTHPEFAKSIFIYCNVDYKPQLEELLAGLDAERIETVHLPVFRGTSEAAALGVQAYLELMLGDKIEGVFDTIPMTDGGSLLYLRNTNAETVKLVEQMINRIDEVSTDEEDEEDALSWDAFVEDVGEDDAYIDYPDNTQEDWAAYGQWVAGKMSGSSSSGSDTDSLTGFSMDSSYTEDLEDTLDSGESATETQQLNEAVEVLDGLFDPNNGSFLPSHGTTADNVLFVSQNAVANASLSDVSVALIEDSVEYAAPTETETGELALTLVLSSGSSSHNYSIHLILPLVPEGETVAP